MVEADTSIHGNLLNVTIRGAVNSSTSLSFRSWVEDKMLDGFLRINMDLSEVEYISSDGISLFMNISRLLASRKGQLSFSGLSDELKLLFGFFKVGDTIPVYENAQDAFPGESSHRPDEKVSADPGKKILSQKPMKRIMSSNRKNLRMMDNTLLISDLVINPAEKTPSPLREKSAGMETPVQEKPAAIENNPETTEIPDKATSIAEIKEKKSDSPYPEKVIFCMNCGAQLKVSKPGKYICPACRLKFTYVN